MSLSTVLRASITTALQSTDADVTGAVNQNANYSKSLADGTTAPGQADLVYNATRTLAGTTSEVLDLAGSLADAFGNTITMVEVVAIIIVNKNTTDGDDLHVGPDATAGFTGPWADASDRSVVAADGCFFWADPNGQAVGAGASDELFVDNQSANSVDYEITVIGRSA